jgi:hypothetical protein
VPTFGLSVELVPAMLAGAGDHLRTARSSGVALRQFGQVTLAPVPA